MYNISDILQIHVHTYDNNASTFVTYSIIFSSKNIFVNPHQLGYLIFIPY